MTAKTKGIRLKTVMRIGICLAMIAAMVLIGAVMVGAEDVKYSEGLAFQSNGDGTCLVDGLGNCKDSNLRIPPVSPDGDVVIGVYGALLEMNETVISLSLPETMKTIESLNFWGAQKLESVIISDSVISIDEAAFCGCPNLKTVVMGSSVERICSRAFWGCDISSIVIPASVTHIGVGAFQDCDKLREITVEKGNDIYYSVGNCIIETKTQTLIAGCQSSIIPNDGSITSIAEHAFWGQTSLESIVIPDSVKHIGSDAFFFCTSLKTVVLPNSLETIYGFGLNYSLSDVLYVGTQTEWDSLITNDFVSHEIKEANIHCLRDIFKITGASLTLGESLTVNYYAEANPDYGETIMRFTYNGETTLVNGILDEASGEYKFTFGRIPPQCMGDEIKAELILTLEDGTELVLDIKESYSVRQYCDDALAANPDNEALATLLADLLAYGNASQDYANYKADAPVSDGFPVAPSEWQDVTDTDFTLTDATREDIRFTAAGVRFAYINRIYFKIKTADLAGVTLIVNGKTYTAEELSPVENADGTYILYTDGIYATEFDKVFTAELAVDGETIQTVTYSVKSYVYSKQNSADTEMAALAKALYNYGRSAIAYVNAQ